MPYAAKLASRHNGTARRLGVKLPDKVTILRGCFANALHARLQQQLEDGHAEIGLAAPSRDSLEVDA